MKTLALVLCLVSPFALSADREVCIALADAVYIVASERNKGVSKYEMRNRVITTYEADIRNAMLRLIEAVYQQPWLEPEQEADKFRRACIQESGQPT